MYPRLLLVNPRAVRPSHAVGITLGSLLAGWPKDRMAQIFAQNEEPDASLCVRNWRLAIEDMRMPLSLHRVVAAWKRWQADTRAAGAPSANGTDDDAKRSCNVFHRAKTSVRSALTSGVLRVASHDLTPQLRRWIDGFRPEVIYSVLEDPTTTAFVKKVSQRYSIPIVPHFMDDWLTMSMLGDAHGGFLARRLRRDALEIMATAPVRMVIGDRMAEEYRTRYGMTFLPFMNCVELGGCRPPNRNRGGKFVFAHCGNLHVGRWRELKDVGVALRELRASDIDAELHVSCGEGAEAAKNQLGKIDSIRCLGSLPLAEVPTVMRNADCLLYVESFTENVKTYMKYSLSAKLPEYFRAGRPILAYGPEDVASIQYVRETGAGIVVGEQDPRALKDAVQRLVQDEDLRLALGARAYRAACRRHDASVVRDAFRSALASAALRAA